MKNSKCRAVGYTFCFCCDKDTYIVKTVWNERTLFMLDYNGKVGRGIWEKEIHFYHELPCNG